jgi:hypothetical protein
MAEQHMLSRRKNHFILRTKVAIGLFLRVSVQNGSPTMRVGELAMWALECRAMMSIVDDLESGALLLVVAQTEPATTTATTA